MTFHEGAYYLPTAEAIPAAGNSLAVARSERRYFLAVGNWLQLSETRGMTFISAVTRLVAVKVRVIDTESYIVDLLAGRTTNSSDTWYLTVCEMSVKFTW